MVKIFLQSFEGGIASVRCLEEGKEDREFRLKLDVKNRKILSSTLNTHASSYQAHAAAKMYKLYEETGTLPEQATSIWY
jgi:hypothetical protein